MLSRQDLKQLGSDLGRGTPSAWIRSFSHHPVLGGWESRLPGDQASLRCWDLQNPHQGWLAALAGALRWSPVSRAWQGSRGQLRPWTAASWSLEWESGLSQQGHEDLDRAQSWPGFGQFGDN